MESMRKAYILADTKIHTLVSIVVLFSFIVGVFLYYHFNLQSIKREKTAELRTIAIFKAEQIAQWYKERNTDVSFFSKSLFTLEAFKQFNQSRSPKILQDIIQRNQLLKKSYGFEDVFTVTIDKKAIYSTATITPINLNPFNCYIDSAITHKKIYTTNYYVNTQTGQLENAIVAPAFDNDQKVLAVMIFCINPQSYLLSVSEKLPKLYNTIETSLLFQFGDSIAIINYSKSNPSKPISITFNKRVEKKKLIIHDIYKYKGYNEKKELIAIAPIKNTSWYIVNKISRKEALTTLNYRSFIFSLIFFFLVAGILFILYILSREQKTQHKLMIKTSEQEKYFNNSIDMLCVASNDGIFKLINPEWERTLGYSQKELIGKAYINFVHPDDVEETIKATTDLANNKKITGFINRYKHKNGSYRWIEWRSYSEGGQIYATARDITDRKKAEDALQQSEEKYRKLFENMSGGFAYFEILFDDKKPIDLKFVDANRKYKEFYNYKDDLIGHNFFETLPIQKEKWITNLEKMVSTNQPFVQTLKFPFNKRFIETIGFMVDSKHSAIILNDVTSRVEAENELRSSEQKFANFFNISPDMVGITRISDGLVLNGNRALTELTGFIPEEYLGRTTKELNWGASFHDRAEMLRLLEEQGEVKNLEIKIRVKDGTILTCLFSCNKFIFNNEECLIFVVHDITDRKNIEETLRKSEAQFRGITQNIPGLVFQFYTRKTESMGFTTLVTSH